MVCVVCQGMQFYNVQMPVWRAKLPGASQCKHHQDPYCKRCTALCLARCVAVPHHQNSVGVLVHLTRNKKQARAACTAQREKNKRLLEHGFHIIPKLNFPHDMWKSLTTADLRSGQVEGVTLAMAQCMVQASESLLPGNMALGHQVLRTGLCCLKGG